MTKPVIILISGKSNAGKGVVGKVLEEELNNSNINVVRCSLSTYIRQITKKDFYWDGVDTPKSRKFMAEVYRVGTEFYPYHMARRVWERDIEPLITVDNTLVAIVESFREKVNYDYFCMLQEEGKVDRIITIRIERPNFDVAGEELKGHVSESDLDEFKFDYYVDNSGTLEEFESQIKEVSQFLKRELI